MHMKWRYENDQKVKRIVLFISPICFGTQAFIRAKRLQVEKTNLNTNKTISNLQLTSRKVRWYNIHLSPVVRFKSCCQIKEKYINKNIGVWKNIKLKMHLCLLIYLYILYIYKHIQYMFINICTFGKVLYSIKSFCISVYFWTCGARNHRVHFDLPDLDGWGGGLHTKILYVDIDSGFLSESLASSLFYASLVLWWLPLWKSYSHFQKWYCLPALCQMSPSFIALLPIMS